MYFYENLLFLSGGNHSSHVEKNWIFFFSLTIVVLSQNDYQLVPVHAVELWYLIKHECDNWNTKATFEFRLSVNLESLVLEYFSFNFWPWPLHRVWQYFCLGLGFFFTYGVEKWYFCLLFLEFWGAVKWNFLIVCQEVYSYIDRGRVMSWMLMYHQLLLVVNLWLILLEGCGSFRPIV